MICAIDPGRDKTGVALFDPTTSAVLYHGIVATTELVDFLQSLDRGTRAAGITKGVQEISKGVPESSKGMLECSKGLQGIMDGAQGITLFLLGDGTHSKDLTTRLKGVFTRRKFELIDEFNSTMEARGLYFEIYPPRGLKRLIPLSMQVPPRPVDDLVAVILIKRYLGWMPKFSPEK